MLNQVVLVGTISCWVNGTLVLRVSKRDDAGGVVEETIPVRINEKIEAELNEHNQIGDTIGVKGSITGGLDKIIIQARSITFLLKAKDR